MIDESTEFGARTATHLREETVLWLTTVTPSGAPLPAPVWFMWDGQDGVRLYSVADTVRTRNIRGNPKVALNFDGDGRGGDIVALSGLATLEPDARPAHDDPDYLAKYAGGLARLAMTPAAFSQQYSVPISITLTRLRGH